MDLQSVIVGQVLGQLTKSRVPFIWDLGSGLVSQVPCLGVTIGVIVCLPHYHLSDALGLVVVYLASILLQLGIESTAVEAWPETKKKKDS